MGILLGPEKVGEVKYNPDQISRAMEVYSTSRPAYQAIGEHHVQPPVSNLKRLTSRVKKLDEKEFHKSIWDSYTDDQKYCVVLFDEVYIRKSLLYHGGEVFGL